ncbi:uncharacterized protein [Dysidea avara]|uniref:uncharacterized protein n=1 Tax=Dysidea avara TaxID=196820 RepID=UPI0033336856
MTYVNSYKVSINLPIWHVNHIRLPGIMNAANIAELIVLPITSILYVVQLFLNYWSSSASESQREDLGFNSSIGDISDVYKLDITPSGWTFSIWGVIYVWQALWLIYGWSFVFRPNATKTVPLLTYVLFSISCLLNIGWLYSFSNYEVSVSFAVLLVLSLILYGATGGALVTYYYKIKHLQRRQRVDLILTPILLHNGLAVYATWTTVATLLNMGIIMQYTGGNRQDAATVGIVVLSILMLEEILWFLLENTVLDRYTRYVYTIYPVLIWALSGIITNNIDNDDHKETNAIAVGALVLSGLLLLLRLVIVAVSHFFRRIEYPDWEYRSV